MSNGRECRLCHAALPAAPDWQVPKTPRGVQFFLTREQFNDDQSVTLDVYACSACGLVQLAGSPVVYTNSFTSATAISPAIIAHRQKQAEEFIRRFHLRNKRILDAGCGDGHFLDLLKNAGADPTGIEPSLASHAIASKTGRRILGGMIQRDHTIDGAPFDAFVTFHVLEHIANPDDFLQGLCQALTDDGVGLIEVPSLERILERRGFFDFMPDHLSYYSLKTLTLQLELNGFDIEDARRDWNGEHAVAMVRKRKTVNFADLQSCVTQLGNDLRQFIRRHIEKGRRVAVWGASHQALSLLPKIDTKDISYIIDSAPYKQGHYTPLSHLPVVGPDHLASHPVDAIIIIAPRYYEEILHQLRHATAFRGTIAAINEDKLEIVRETS